MIYRVKLEMGFRACCFDFENSNTAVAFMENAVKNFISEASDSDKFNASMEVREDDF